MLEVSRSLDDTAESVIFAGKKMAELPKFSYGFESLFFSKATLGRSSESLKQFASEYVTLDKNQKEAVRGLIDFSEEQQGEFNKYLSYIKSGTLVSGHIFADKLQLEGLTREEQNQVLIKLKLADSERKLTLASKENIEAYLKSAEALESLTPNQRNAIDNCLQQTLEVQELTKATKESIISQKAWNTFMTIGKNLLLNIGIGVLTWGLTELAKWAWETAHAYDGLVNSAAEAHDEWEAANSNVEEASGQLESLKEQLDACKDSDTGEIVKAGEYEKLLDENRALEQRLELLKDIREQEIKDTNDATYKVWTDTSQHKGETTYEYLQRQVKTYYDLVERRKNAVFEFKDDPDEYAYQYENLTELIDDTYREILDVYSGMEDVFADAVESSSDEYQQMSDEMDHATELAHKVSSAYNGVASAASAANSAISNFEAPDWEALSTTIDSIQDSFKNLTSAMQEYNTSGYLSMDTLQSLLAMKSDYLACLQMENGKLMLNADAFQIATMAQLDNARAEAVNQYATELKNIAQRDSTAATVASIGATADQVEALAVLSEILGDTTASTIGYAKAQELLSLYEAANAKNATETAKATDAFNARMALIDQVAAQASSGIRGLTNTLGDYSETSKEATKQLEKQQNLLKIRGQAAVDVLEKQIDKLNEEKDIFVENIDAEIDALQKKQEEQEDAAEERIEALQKERDAIEDLKNTEDKELRIAQLREALAKAQSSRTMRKYVEGQGYIWTVDQKAIDEAQQELDDQLREDTHEARLEAIDKEIEAIEKERDAFKEACDDEIKALEEKKDAQEKATEEEVKRLEKLKEKYNEVLGLIGTDWEDYQAMLDATAEFEAMTFEEMSNYVTTFKNDVEENMKAISAANKAAEQSVNDLMTAYGRLSSYTGEAPSTETSPTPPAPSAQILSSGFSSQGEATSKISQYGGDGIVQGGDGLWYVTKNWDNATLSGPKSISSGGGKITAMTKATGDILIPRSGPATVDENGPELIVRNPFGGRTTWLEHADGVVPANITARLFEIGGDTSAWFARQMGQYRNSTGGNSTVMSVGDIIINKPIGDENQLAHALQQRFGTSMMREMKRR